MTPVSIIDDAAFDRLLLSLGPFEHRPKLAVAVSGGSDSLALTLLAARWAETRQGSVLALTVDHRLRKDAPAEARQVGGWLAARGIAHEILAWTGPKPASGIQAAARTARYRLLLDRCRAQGILHLLLAHHQNDQAETVLLRIASGSGADGLAAIAPVTPTESARLLRPLLGVPKAALEATLRHVGQAWIEDPSNRNPAFARVRVRALMPSLDEAGASSDTLAGLAAQASGIRHGLDDEAAELCARAVMLSQAGFVRLNRGVLSGADVAIGRRVLDRVLRTIGGSVYPPRGDRLDRLWSEMRSGLAKRRSLGGCFVTPVRDGWVVQREPAGMAPPVACGAGRAVRWDGRFTAIVNGPGRLRLGALGQQGWLTVKNQVNPGPIPAAVAPTLPALLDGAGNPAAIPHLQWQKRGFDGLSMVDLAFVPNSPLTGGLVWHHASTMC